MIPCFTSSPSHCGLKSLPQGPPLLMGRHLPAPAQVKLKRRYMRSSSMTATLVLTKVSSIRASPLSRTD
jgi:hypothetical protein